MAGRGFEGRSVLRPYTDDRCASPADRRMMAMRFEIPLYGRSMLRP